MIEPPVKKEMSEKFIVMTKGACISEELIRDRIIELYFHIFSTVRSFNKGIFRVRYRVGEEDKEKYYGVSRVFGQGTIKVFPMDKGI